MVDWMIKNIPEIQSRQEAVEVGNDLMNKGIIIDHDNEWLFHDGLYYYSFQGAVLKSGYLIKRGRVKKSLKLRWFVLQEQELLYYETPRQLEKPLGSIPIKNAAVRVWPNNLEDQFYFELTVTDRVYFLIAENYGEMKEWVQELSKATVQVSAENDLLSQAEEIICREAQNYSQLIEQKYHSILDQYRNPPNYYIFNNHDQNHTNIGDSNFNKSQQQDQR